MIEIRASRAGLAWACPQSVQASDIRVGGEIPALGQAMHYMLWTGIAHGQHLEVADVAAMFDADPEELDRLMPAAWSAWNGVNQYYPEPQCEFFIEHDFGGLRLSGHIDVISWPALRFLDWKSSWTEEDHHHQMMAYAALVLSQTKQDEVYGATIWPRQGISDGKTYRRPEVMAWVEGLKQRLTGQDANVYHAGDHCARCERAATCPEIAAELHKAQLALVDWQSLAHLIATDADMCAKLYERVRLVARACQVALDAIKARVAAAGGQFGNLVITEQGREMIRYTPEVSAQILASLSYEDLEKIIKISKTELAKAIMDNAPHRKKGAEWHYVQERLREMGAVEKTFITKLALKRQHAKPAITDASAAE